jgi:type III pantothenate kinase
MNLLAIDIGNTNITMSLFVKSAESVTKSIPGIEQEELVEFMTAAWESIPMVEFAKTPTKDGVILVSSVKPEWTQKIADIAKKTLKEEIKVIGKDIPVPIELAFDDNRQTGTDRLLTAAAAYQVIGDAVVVADFGTAVTIDLVDDSGKFLGGTIFPGFDLAAKALSSGTAQLPEIEFKKPEKSFGQSTAEAINCGIFFSLVSTLQEITRRYAEHLGKWPQTILTGSFAQNIVDDCDFVDNYVPNLVAKGIALAYRNYIEDKK